MTKSVLMLCLCGVCMNAKAETRPTEEGEMRGDTVNLRELTVVATKENSPYREQPLSVSTLGPNALQSHQVWSLKGTSQMVPNFYMPDYGSRLTSAIYIRGIGSRINTPAVGLYVDDVPFHDKSAFDFNLCDIERIDVLRGPQGTIYGRNTMGGLVKVYTRTPLTYEGTNLNLGYATRDNHRHASLTHYHHPSEKLAFSAGGYYEGSDGLFRNALTGGKVDDMEAGGARLRGIWMPAERWTLDAGVNYDLSREGAYPYYYEGQLNPAAEAYPERKGQIANNREGRYRRNMLSASLNAEYRAERMTLNSVTAYQNLHDRMFFDQDMLPADIYTLTQKQRINNINEEVTLKSNYWKRWSWVSGANLMYQALRTEAPVEFKSEGVKWLNQVINSSLPDLTQAGMGPMSVTMKNTELPMGGTFDTPVLGAGLFHQSTVELVEGLSLTAGLRLDYEHNEMKYCAPGSVDFDFAIRSANPRNSVSLTDLQATPGFDGKVKKDYWQLLPKAALKYEFNDRNNIYAAVSRGSRSGGYNVQMFSDLLQTEMRRTMMSTVVQGTEQYLKQLFANVPNIPGFDPQAHIEMIMGRINQNMPAIEQPDVRLTTVYKPEYSWNYELGTHLSSNDNRLQADAALFYIDTRDQQIARFSANGLGRMMVNAGRSRSYGAELSLRAMPNRHLSLMANYGLTNAEFRDYDDGQGIDYTGNRVPFVPQHTVCLDGAYTFFFQNEYVHNLSLGATWSGAGNIYWNEQNTASEDFYNLLSARATLGTKWAEVELWGRNLTQTSYKTFYFESMGRGFSQHGKPLQVGIDLRLHF